MTRKELHTELNKINSCIEILRDLIEKPLCGCLSHISSINEEFKKDNMEQLNMLLKVKYFLLSLIIQSDEALAKVVYQPVAELK